MTGRRRTVTALALVTVGFGTTGLQADESRSAKDVRPTYPRQRVERAEPAPERRQLPDSLRIAEPRGQALDTGGERRHDGAARTRPGPGGADDERDLRTRAQQAAVWAAGEAIERHGRPRTFEVGFHQGLHDAFRLTQHERWEFEQGRRQGGLDPEAGRVGEEIGYEEAQLASAESAHRSVVEQFGDLTREPVRLPAPPPPPFAVTGFEIVEPELHDVFRDLSWRGQRTAGLRHLRIDPWRLYRAGRHAELYRRDWATARFGLDLWRQRHGRSGWARALDVEERRLFEEWFETAFETELARRFDGLADRAFDRGYGAGWRHGIRVGREWQFRRGFHEGFEDGVRRAAHAAFYDSFRPSWSAAYEASFDEWSSSVKLVRRAARLWDGNDDGIFEPGEELHVELEVVNVGGASGRLEARLTGPVLTGPDRLVVDLPRRSALPRPVRLRSVVSPAAEPMTDAFLTASLGELSESLPLRVSHVLRFEDAIVLAEHQALRGTAAVDVRVANASRRAVLASLEAGVHGGFLHQPRRELAAIAPGAVQRVRFEIRGAHPLDLLAGDLVLTVAASTGGRAQDRLEARLPDLATDLEDRSLIDYLTWLGRNPADRVEMSRAHRLVLRRLEADWRAVIRQKGNPYKHDLRTGAEATALGELVAASRSLRGRGVDQSVFSDLAPRIDELSRSLPGTHPFLRRAMRKLGRQLL